MHPSPTDETYFQPLGEKMCLVGRDELLVWITFVRCLSLAKCYVHDLVYVCVSVCVCLFVCDFIIFFPNKANRVSSISVDQTRPIRQLITLQIMKRTSSTLTCKGMALTDSCSLGKSDERHAQAMLFTHIYLLPSPIY